MGQKTTRSRIWTIAATVVLLAASCGGDDETATTNASRTTEAPTATQAPVTTQAPATTQAATQGTDAPTEPAPTCGDDAERIEVGATIEGTLELDGQFLGDRFFCFEIEDGAETVSVALTGMTSDLALFVGYPDLATVQGGGSGSEFWSSTTSGLVDESVLIEPGFTRGQFSGFEQNEFVTPGSYYIEVSAGGTADPSPFTLTVRIP